MTSSAGFQAKLDTHPTLDKTGTTTSRPCGGELLPNTTKFLNNFRIGENNTTAEKNILKQKK
jgi:hypothetical protein